LALRSRKDSRKWTVESRGSTVDGRHSNWPNTTALGEMADFLAGQNQEPNEAKSSGKSLLTSRVCVVYLA